MNFKHILGLTAATLILNVSFFADASAASIRLTCETKSTRVKISVDGNNLATGSYRAKVKSGTNVKTSPFKPTIGDEVEFDFDSNTEAGAVKIITGFIKNSEVTAWIYDEDNFVVATTTSPCKKK